MARGLPTDKWKNTLDDYVSAAGRLYNSMVLNGFDPAYPIPLDPYGELLDGSHRLACALALGVRQVPVRYEERLAWAPAWDFDWFIDHKMPLGELNLLKHDFEAIQR